MIKKYSIAEFARLCGVSRVTIYSYIKKGIIAPKKTVLGKPYFLEEDFELLKRELNNEL